MMLVVAVVVAAVTSQYAFLIIFLCPYQTVITPSVSLSPPLVLLCPPSPALLTQPVDSEGHPPRTTVCSEVSPKGQVFLVIVAKCLLVREC